MTQRQTLAFFLALALSMTSASVRADDFNDLDFQDLGDIIDEPEVMQIEQRRNFKPEIQRDFVIIDYPHEYDFNPHTSNYANEAQLFTGLYEGLFSYDPYSLEPRLALAESYHISRDKKIWVFKIRKDAKFSNGEAITAQSVRDSWLRLLAPKTNAPFASLLDCVSGAEAYRTGRGTEDDVGISARDAHTLVVRLANPTEHLPRILCHHAFSAVYRTQGVFSGPFILKSADANSIQLVKNTQYREEADVAIPSITLKMSEDVDENAYQVNTGGADWVTSVVNTQKLLDNQLIKIFGEFATEYLFFKADRAPWNNAAFRQALLTAVPWKTLRSQALVPAKTFIYALPGYVMPDGYTETDSDEARILFEEAKASAGMKAGDAVTVVLAVGASEYMKKQADILKTAWEKIGVTVEVQTTPVSRYLQSIDTWKADVFAYTWIGDFADPIAFLELFRGSSSLNVTEWRNAEFDKLLDEAAACTNFKERFAILSRAENVLLNSGVVIPVSHPVSLNIVDTEAIGGWYGNALDIHPLRYLYFTGETSAVPNLVRR